MSMTGSPTPTLRPPVDAYRLQGSAAHLLNHLCFFGEGRLILRQDGLSLAKLTPFGLCVADGRAGWHLLRTAAWWQCFPQQQRPSFWRAFRVRLAAEAFSYVTIRGVAGEPLKVLLLTREIGKDVSSSAVALERAAYTVVTIAIVGLGAATALLMLPLTPMWSRIFSVLAVAAALLVLMSVVLLASRARTRPTERFGSRDLFRSRHTERPRFSVRLNATHLTQYTFVGEDPPERSWHEIIPAGALKAQDNELTFNVSGQGTVIFGDVVILYTSNEITVKKPVVITKS